MRYTVSTLVGPLRARESYIRAIIDAVDGR